MNSIVSKKYRPEDFSEGQIHEMLVTLGKLGFSPEMAAMVANAKSGKALEIISFLNEAVPQEILKLVDKNGRIIPRGVRSAVCDANKNFCLKQPQLDYAARLVRFQEAFGVDPVMSAADFEGRSQKLIAEIANNKALANLLQGVYLPLILPKLDNFQDYGKTLADIFLPVLQSNYEKQYPDRKFYNWRKDDLADKVSIVPESRHDRIVERMKQGFLVAIYFPAPLQGFSVLASREQMAGLPECLLLSGGLDTISAATMYPDVMARDYNTPGYDLAALSWRSPVHSLYLGAGDGLLGFDFRGYLGDANVFYSSGLVFLGSA